MTPTAAVLTISDSVTAGVCDDMSGPTVCQRLHRLGWKTESAIVPDVQESIAAKLIQFASEPHIRAIFTTGGTGVAPRDVTPEATRSVIDREIPGLAEHMRREGLRFTPRSILSRAVVGSRGHVLIVNLPGSPKGAVQSLDCIVEHLPHVLDLLAGHTQHEHASETTATLRTSDH